MDYISVVKDDSEPKLYTLNPILKGFTELYKEH